MESNLGEMNQNVNLEVVVDISIKMSTQSVFSRRKKGKFHARLAIIRNGTENKCKYSNAFT